jgi:TonB family protein
VRQILTFAAVAAVLVASAAAQERNAYKVGQDGVKAPVIVQEVKPRYTDEAKARGVQGTVMLAAIVKADGTVDQDVRVTRSLDPDLDTEAVKALRQWRFRPGTKDGAPVDVQVDVELTFTLK